MDEDIEIVKSPLCRTFVSGGKKVDVEIYGDGSDEWVLELVDNDGNSTVWDDPFETDQAALDEFRATIEKDGIESLIG